jgi:hypothetical protein
MPGQPRTMRPAVRCITIIIMERQEDGEGRYVRWVRVGTYFFHAEALMARMLLESSGITCYLRDEGICRLYELAAPALGGIKLMVAEEDAARAADLLSQSLGQPYIVEPLE